MRKTIAILTALALTLTSSAAVVGHNDSGGDMQIMSSGASASASTAVGPNGTEWTAEVSMKDSHAAEDPLGNIGNANFSSGEDTSSVSFTGEIVAGTPCHVIDHEVEEQNGTYVMNIKTLKDDLDNQGMCTQVMTGIDYDASFQTDEAFKLEVRHNGEEVDTLEHPEYGSDKKPHSDPGRKIPLIDGLIDLLSGLF